MIDFRLPSLGSDMDEGTLLQWLVTPGEAVHKGQIIAVVDTAKAAIDVECWHDGVVHALLVEPQTTIPAGATMAILREPGETAEQVDALLAAMPLAAQTVISKQILPAAPAVAVPVVTASAARQRISPAARKHAQELGIDIERIEGSGPDGALTLADIDRFAKAAPQPAAVPASKADLMRQTIAAAMSRAKREIPHYYLAEDIALERPSVWLADQNAQRGLTERLLMASVLLKAVAAALAAYPQFNGFWKDDAFVPGAGIHVGVAISLRQGGLIAPAIRNLDQLDLGTLTGSLLDLVKRARAGSLRSSEMTDATVTVTNLGDQGVGAVFGVIYPPQVALVGFGRVTQRPWVAGDSIRPVPVITASLSADHRVTDGHLGARFLAAIRDALQEPQALGKISQEVGT
jgi:pyruvate dehydrogenase E2 component (dihydrolipoamide acetyltransferase)